MCQGSLVLVDVDVASFGTRYVSGDRGATWSSSSITAGACPDGLPFAPRDTGYSLASFPYPALGKDRLIIVGGDDTDTDVWVSDDCGQSFTCIDAPEDWDPRQFSWVGTVPAAPGVFFGGGVTMGLPSVGFFMSTDGGGNWSRPPCDPAVCQFPFPDTMNQYLLPDSPACPGMFAADASTLWFWDDTAANVAPDFPYVWYLNASNIAAGWMGVPGSTLTGALGRKVWLGGTEDDTQGCWFSADRDDMGLWVDPLDDPLGQVNSINIWATSPVAWGPWTAGPVPAPWPARAAGALLSLDGSVAVYAGGMTFVDGQAQDPTFGDVWQIDAGVCLYAPNGAVCSGHGTPDLGVVVCQCDPNWSGDAMCGSCTPGTTYGPTCMSCPTSAGGSPCNAAGGGGYCDSVQGCVCGTGWAGAACDTCALNYAGPACAACATCNPRGGSCNGNGTTGGTGACVCNPGWSGPTCAVPPPPPPPDNAPTAGGLSAGGAAGVSITVLGLAGAGLAFFAVKTYGSIGAAAAAAKAAAAKATAGASYSKLTAPGSGSGGGGERTSLVSGQSSGAKAVRLSPDQAAKRLGSYGSTSPGATAL